MGILLLCLETALLQTQRQCGGGPHDASNVHPAGLSDRGDAPEVDIGNAELLRRDLRSLCRTHVSPSSPDGVAAVVVDWAAAPFLTLAGVAVLEDLRQQAGEQGIACGWWCRADGLARCCASWV
jgi:sirohydrochlorin ferrochelatase